MLLETFDPHQKIKVMCAHIFGNLIRMYYTVSNHPPSTTGRYTKAGTSLFQERALTFRNFRPLVSKIRVTSILLIESDRRRWNRYDFPQGIKLVNIFKGNRCTHYG